jgi:amino acid adenylation domain-containing protein
MTSLVEPFRAAAADHAARPALILNGQSLSYGEMFDQALRLAAGLRGHGLGPGSRVALWAPKRAETYVSVWASLALGAAYVPVDLTAPAARAAWIVEDSGAEALVCRAFDFAQIPRPLPACLKVVALLDGGVAEAGPVPAVPWAELAGRRRDDAALGAGPSGQDLAYILYTSGSTGTPKGVAISHAASRAFVDWAGDLTELTPEDRVSNHAALSFDLSVFDLFSTARAGAALLPVPQWPAGQGYPFARFIAQQGITVWYSVPTLLARMAASQETKPVDLGSLRVVVFAGEVFPKPRLVHFRQAVPGPRLFNWYGPTETNVCTTHEVGDADLLDEGPLPIGRPCPFAGVHLRDADEDGQGELLVSGGSLMEGYWRAGRIDTGAFASVPGDPRRYYPTGDLVSQGPDGVIRFHGRADSQVKIHGYRVELGEIEEVLEGVEHVAEAAVVCVADTLFAFVSPPEGSATLFSEGGAREHLARHLPTYMVPSRIQVSDSLPRTERGKIDRKALIRSVTAEMKAETP